MKGFLFDLNLLNRRGISIDLPKTQFYWRSAKNSFMLSTPQQGLTVDSQLWIMYKLVSELIGLTDLVFR